METFYCGKPFQKFSLTAYQKHFSHPEALLKVVRHPDELQSPQGSDLVVVASSLDFYVDLDDEAA